MSAVTSAGDVDPLGVSMASQALVNTGDRLFDQLTGMRSSCSTVPATHSSGAKYDGYA